MYIHLDRDNVLASVEAADAGVTETELEYEFYGKLGSHDDLVAAATTTELQEQYEIKKPGGSIRVRMSNVAGAVTYMLNSKIWESGQAGKDEVEHEVTADMFTHFKHIADSGMIKTRYTIPAGQQRLSNGDLEPITWEYDVFENREGKRSDWVKIDLEVKEPLMTIPDLPVAISDAIRNQKNYRTPAEVKKLTKLFQEEFLVGPGKNNVEQGEKGTPNQGAEDAEGNDDTGTHQLGNSTEGFFSEEFKEEFKNEFLRRVRATSREVAMEGMFTDMFKNLFGKSEKPLVWHNGADYKNNLQTLEQLEQTIKSEDMEFVAKPVSDKVAALFQIGKRPLRGTSIKDLTVAMRPHRKVLIDHLGGLKRYDALMQSEAKKLHKLSEITDVELDAMIAKLTDAKTKLLSRFSRPVDMLGASAIVDDGGYLTKVSSPVLAKINTLDTKDDVLLAIDLLKMIYKNEQELPYYLDADVSYVSYDDDKVPWDDLDELNGNDSLSGLVYFQSVQHSLVDALYDSSAIGDLLLEYILVSIGSSREHAQ